MGCEAGEDELKKFAILGLVEKSTHNAVMFVLCELKWAEVRLCTGGYGGCSLDVEDMR